MRCTSRPYHALYLCLNRGDAITGDRCTRWRQLQVVINLRSATKDRLLGGSVSSRVVNCHPGTQQAAALLVAIRSGLREVSAQLQQQQKAARTVQASGQGPASGESP